MDDYLTEEEAGEAGIQKRAEPRLAVDQRRRIGKPHNGGKRIDASGTLSRSATAALGQSPDSAKAARDHYLSTRPNAA
jgi:hypothetical protein